MTDGPERGVVEPAKPSRAPSDAVLPPPPSIHNSAELSAHGLTDLRRRALDVAAVGLAACDAARAVTEAVELTDAGIAIHGTEHRLEEGARLVVLGSGKASPAIAAALERVLGDRIDAGVIVARRGEEIPLAHIEMVAADHPIPSEASVEAAHRLLDTAAGLRAGDLAITCITGGSSALTSLPPEGVSVAEKRLLHELLLQSGMPITEVNAVRKHVSAIKAGRLAAAIAPARVVNLTVSDVARDRLDVITDPSVQDTSTVADAVAALNDYAVWEAVPESVRAHLGTAAAESPSLEGVEISTTLLVTGRSVCQAMALEASALGVEPTIVSTSLEGEARELGRFVANLARESARAGAPFAAPGVLLACGGESTVTVGEAAFGAGGPNQEAALAAALELDGAQVAAVMVDTDGSDGGTEVAGGVVDGSTQLRARELGIDLREAVLAHRSTAALEKLGDVVRTGPTGTNVNDLIVVAVGEVPA